MTKLKDIIKKIDILGAFAIKTLKESDFTLEVTKYIANNLDFTQLIECHKNIPEKAKREYHQYLQKELEKLKKGNMKLTKEKIAEYVNYIDFDDYLSESDKKLYKHFLYHGIEIN